MPKLTKTVAQNAAAASETWNDRKLLDNGVYLAKLLSVESKDGAAGPYWSWKYEEANSTNHLYDNTSLSEKAIGRLGKVFEAFGVSADTDTDLLLGRAVALKVSTRTIQSGDKKGEQGNQIDSVMPPTEHPDYDATQGGGKASVADFGGDDGMGADDDL